MGVNQLPNEFIGSVHALRLRYATLRMTGELVKTVRDIF